MDILGFFFFVLLVILVIGIVDNRNEKEYKRLREKEERGETLSEKEKKVLDEREELKRFAEWVVKNDDRFL